MTFTVHIQAWVLISVFCMLSLKLLRDLQDACIPQWCLCVHLLDLWLRSLQLSPVTLFFFPSLLRLSSCICDIKQQWIGITQPHTHTHTHAHTLVWSHLSCTYLSLTLLPFCLGESDLYYLAWQGLAHHWTRILCVCVCVCVSGIRAQLARWGEKLPLLECTWKDKDF